LSTLKQFEVCGSHFEVGLAIGERFAEQIHRALDSYPFLQERILPYHQTTEGQARFRELLDLHRARYPDYMAELDGMSQGAGRHFRDLFLVNLRGEYAGYLRGPARGCFDCTLVTDDMALIGHNEDGSPAFRGNVYLVRAQVRGKPILTALSYPGFLCGNAFGFNAEGVCFSCDNVRPQTLRVGVGRHFLARSLLEARSVDGAIERVTAAGRASGFGYTIGSVQERRVVYVEVAPETSHVREVCGCYVHANHYRELDGVDQIVGPSSAVRVERAGAILRDSVPVDSAEVLSLLGDRAHGEYPIYRNATPPDELATLHTALFDLDARRLRIYTSHPTQAPDEFLEFDI
jgi:predicted choloylglycine hydrolase